MKRNREELRRARERRDRKRDQQLSVGRLLELALDSLRNNEVDAALILADRAIQADPCCVLAYLVASRACLSKKDVKQAIGWCLRGREANPQSAEIDCELGALYSEQSSHDAACDVWHSAINKDAKMVLAYENLVSLLTELERPAEAEQVILKFLAIEPEHNAMRRRLARNLRAQQRYEEAIEILHALIAAEPLEVENYRILAAAYRSCNQMSQYVETLTKWLAIDPENATVKHMLGCGNDANGTPLRADDEYVRVVFDRFASTFDQNLDSLQYKGPAIIENLIFEYFGPPSLNGSLIALDAGCGTGLCGPKLKPYCKQLVGVDLSSEMVKIANDRGCYDLLKVEELTSYLKRNAGLWDLIVAADTFNYFGDLDALFEVCSDALKTNGVLMFTLEHELANEVQSYRLKSNGRYCHSSSYVESMLLKNRFKVKSVSNQVLRLEADKPVNSIVVGAEKCDYIG